VVLTILIVQKNKRDLLLYIMADPSSSAKSKEEIGKELSTFHFASNMLQTGKKTAVMVFASFMVGLIAALMGAGGGIVLNPILLELGLPPEVL
jgi:uncharacterized membrane protein YfcA